MAWEWPCWLPVVLAWGLPVVCVFIPLRLKKLFQKMTAMEIEWNNLKNWFDVSCLPSDWLECTLLVSGKCDFISATLSKLSTHVGPLVCSVDMGFSEHRLRLVWGLYSS